MKEIIISKLSNIGALVNFLSNPNNKDFIQQIEKEIPNEIISQSISEKLWYYLNEKKELQKCECGELLLFHSLNKGFKKTCGQTKCVIKSRQKTSLQNWGVDNPKKSKQLNERINKKILEKYNGEHYMKDSRVRNKFKKTMIDKWGVEWAQQSKEISNKSIETWEKNPNRDIIIEKRRNSLLEKSDDEKLFINNKKQLSILEKFGSKEEFDKYRQKKIKEKAIEKWGTEHHFHSLEVQNKRRQSYIDNITNKILSTLPDHITYIDRKSNQNETDSYIYLNCKKCENAFEITRQLLYKKINVDQDPCPTCNPQLSGKSNEEISVLNFIKENYTGDVISNYRVFNKEVDVYLPDSKIAFEFNGLYWHNEEFKSRQYHLEKTKFFQSIGINLIHIWEDDWLYKREIVESIIINKIGGTKQKIFARNCEIKEINEVKTVREFLNKNHLQGFIGSSHKIGLYYENELVSLITFGHLRRSLGGKPQDNYYELIRFCNKKGTIVIGGASKLLKYFINKYSPQSIISYSDLSRSTGGMYKKLGFNLVGTSEPNYYYIIGGLRKHRFDFRKDKLVSQGYDKNLTEIEIMTSRGISRIFDCGMQKWELKK